VSPGDSLGGRPGGVVGGAAGGVRSAPATNADAYHWEVSLKQPKFWISVLDFFPIVSSFRNKKNLLGVVGLGSWMDQRNNA